MAIPPSCERVFLIGPRGAGKSNVGRLLAEQLHWRFIDTDDEVEMAAGKTIAQIFETEGVDEFRDREETAVAASGRESKMVIATGGGAVVREVNRVVIAGGFVVWLTASSEVLFKRIIKDPESQSRRPALMRTGDLLDVEDLNAQREPYYRELAQLTVDTTELSPPAVVSSILA